MKTITIIIIILILIVITGITLGIYYGTLKKNKKYSNKKKMN